MGISLSTGVPPPDDVLLSVNTSTNKLQLKPGTRGDILYAGASGVWGILAKGTDGQYLKIGANDPAWSDVPGEGWTHIETLSPSAASSVTTTGTITVYEEYLVTMQITSSAATNLQMRFNGDTGSNYAYTTITGVGTGQSVVTCGDTTTTANMMGYFRIAGITKATASGVLCANLLFGAAGTNAGVQGQWAGGNATQITSITWFPGSGTITGVIRVYGRNI